MKHRYVITNENGVRIVKNNKLIEKIEKLFELSDYEDRCKEVLKKELNYFIFNKAKKMEVGIYNIEISSNERNNYITITNRIENRIEYEINFDSFNFYNTKTFSDILDDMVESYGTQIIEDKLVNLDYVYAVFKTNIQGYDNEWFNVKNTDFAGFYASKYEAEKVIPINLKMEDGILCGNISFYIKLEKKFIEAFINRKGLFKYFNSILFFNMIEEFESHYDLLYKKNKTIDSILAFKLYSYCKDKNIDFTGFKTINETIIGNEKVIKTIKYLNEINSTKESLEKIIAGMLIESENIKSLEDVNMSYKEYILYLTDIIEKLNISIFLKNTHNNLGLKAVLKIKDEILDYFKEKKKSD